MSKQYSTGTVCNEKIMQTVLFYRQSKQRLKGMNKKGNSIDRKNVKCYYKKRGGRRIKLCILHKQGGKF